MTNWIIEQQWNHVLFSNWRVQPEQLQKLIPFDLDLYEGDAVLSVVPFLMTDIRFPYTPKFPWVSKLWELNLRTYVVQDGVPGIYFLTLDTSHRLGNWIAQSFFKLPYRFAEMKCTVAEQQYRVESKGTGYKLQLEAELSAEEVKDPFQCWVTERYHLFLKNERGVIRGDVHHAPWRTKKAVVKNYSGNFSDQYGIRLLGPPSSVYYAEKLKVRFAPFRAKPHPNPS